MMAEPAVLLGESDAEQTESADFPIQVARKLFGFIPLVDERGDFIGYEIPDRAPEHLMFLCVYR